MRDALQVLIFKIVGVMSLYWGSSIGKTNAIFP